MSPINPLYSNVVVDVTGISRGISDDGGHFLVAIPSNSAKSKYEISFRAIGYKNASDTPSSLTGPEPEPITVHLEAEKLDGTSLLHVVEVKFGQLVGVPTLWVHLFVRNPLAKSIELNGMSASLIEPNGKSFMLIYAAWAPNMMASFSFPGLTNIIYACWKANKPYDESFYVQALEKRNFSVSTT